MWILKVIMCVFNGVIFLAGGVAVSVGILVAMSSKYLRIVLDHIKDSPPALAQVGNVGYLLIAVGAVLAIMGFLGCCGALCESKCMLLTFFIIILIVFLAEVAGAVIILLFKPTANEVLQKLNQEVVDLIKKDYGSDDAFTTVMNETMSQLTCCGYNNYTDFTGSPFQTTTSRYPESCCRSNGTCIERNAEAQGVRGCFNSFVQLLEDNAAVLGGVAIGIAALEIAAMVVSMVLYKNVGK
ncbi:tetraspanin-1-like [Colossoma macropomum]|uniref:tetraspanin-1-like n=1 Tax=Colossoma macropomum TaxID=42526 RepID=UPI001863BFC1|nr:tetraspanin-1-like [Colossoma macropomum]